MAKLRFKCACGKTLVVDEQFAGKTARCPICKRSVIVPEADNAPRPDTVEIKDLGEEMVSLSQAYGAAVLAKARQERAQAALDEVDRKQRRRNVTIAVSSVVALLALFILYKLFQSYGPAIGRVGAYPEAVQPFVRGLNKADPRVRAAATWEVADAGGKEQTPLVALMLDAPEPLVRIVAVRALGRVDPDGAREHAKRLLEDDDPDVRMTAAFVLAKCSESGLSRATLAPHVAQALSGRGDWLTWFQDLNRRKTTPSDVRDFLETQLRSPDPKTRAVAAWMTAATLAADPILLPLLRDRRADVVASTCHALQPFLEAEAFERLRNSPTATESLRRRFTVLYHTAARLTHEDRRVRTAAILAITYCGQDKAARLFGPALKSSDWFVRFAALKGLLKLRPEVALAAARKAKRGGARANNKWTRRLIDLIERRAASASPAKEPS